MDHGLTSEKATEMKPAPSPLPPAPLPDEALQWLLPLDFLPRAAGAAWRWQWPPGVEYALRALAAGPATSGVAAGVALGEAIQDMRRELRLGRCHGSLHTGLHTFFHQVLPPAAAASFFLSTLPGMAVLALSLPAALQAQHAAALQGHPAGRHSPLRILPAQQPGLVMLTQELIAALLACSFLCLFPTGPRTDEMLPAINCDRLFGLLVRGAPSQAAKVQCLVHYFGRVTQQPPRGTVTFERKVLPLPGSPGDPPAPLPTSEDWAASTAALCPLQVLDGGTIEDDGAAYLQVDFANAFLGGGVLGAGCVQEEIRFMLCPELLVGMLFLPALADNEAIEVVGAERYSAYTGYADTFQFAGDFVDATPRDALGRRATHLVAIDALANPGTRQWASQHRLREVNKAFCGFLDHAPRRGWVHDPGALASPAGAANEGAPSTSPEGGASTSGAAVGMLEGAQSEAVPAAGRGVATGNWGCGAFGGDVQLKALLQWMAATQAGRPQLLYCSFGDAKAARLAQVGAWLRREGWAVGELWAMLHEYAQRRTNDDCPDDLFQWLLPQQPRT
ncbi:Poly (ADP-ribose) glycohydrolase [Klebsormidium nitens]|uniref:poly(ADP-ribose) glycohydrolase n=1 Tax=Klebsormidium nitens TaxID=105231 RepID=A0A1Y1IRE5_KLENI|nr:Poly (ADP-ribose) glycohydrolase [Klebsormidium nitens]|eukprot:GAQ91316.1 Poly (ADP-ribose) glycohydrolase [Klebsormidium nitens]